MTKGAAGTRQRKACHRVVWFCILASFVGANMSGYFSSVFGINSFDDVSTNTVARRSASTSSTARSRRTVNDTLLNATILGDERSPKFTWNGTTNSTQIFQQNLSLAKEDSSAFFATNKTAFESKNGTNFTLYDRNVTRPWAALCAVMRDEDLYIDEWVDYHLALGFERVHIYDAHPNFTLAQWYEERQLQNPISNIGIHLTHRVLPDEGNVQELVYGECLDHLRTLPSPPKWVMVLDGDEFLVFRNHSQYSHVVDFLTDHLLSGSLQISWIVMGTGNETNYRDEPVTKRFQYAITERKFPETKAVAVLDHIDGWKVHYVFHKSGYGAVAMGGRPIGLGRGILCCIADPDVSVAAVFHYTYKSEEEYTYKICVRGDIYKFLNSICETAKPVAGDVFDDGAWQAMVRLLPKYASLAG